MSFKKGFEKTAFEFGGKTINDRIGNPFGKTPVPPPPPPPAPKNVAASGRTLGQMIGFPGT